MFSQFRHAVEQLAQQVPVPHVSSGDDQERRPSLDIQALANGQLAGDTLHSLRKSLSQRSTSTDGTATPLPSPNGRASPSNPPVRKSNLEERLRRAAANAIVEASANTPSPPPDPSKKSPSSPSPPQSVAQKRVMSPASIPLPQSPALLADDAIVASEPTSNAAQAIEAIPELELEKEVLDTTSPEQPVVAAPVESAEEENTNVNPTTGKEEGEEEAQDLTEEPESLESDSITISNESAVSSSPPLEPQLAEESTPLAKVPTPVVAEETSPSPREFQPEEDAAVATQPSPLLEDSTAASNSEEKDEEQSVGSEDIASSILAKEIALPVQPEPKVAGVGVEELQKRLKQVEQRFTDVSTSFKRLQAEKVAADSVLRECTPIDTIQDTAGLSDYLKNLRAKQEIFQTEIKLLNGKLANYEERLGELRDAHRLETKSQIDQIDKLRTQLQETEALFQASENAITQAEDKLASEKSDTQLLQTELEKYKTVAKEEEEKRVKAISLLKTVRQKLVKTEREKEEALRELAASRDRDRGDKEKDHIEKLKLQQELEMVQIEKEKMAAAQKAQFDRELGLLRERYEKDLSAVKGGLELEIITLKSSHSKELAAKGSQISSLENSLNSVTRDKNVFFEQLQIKQAETESAQSHLESLQHQNTELEFQLREANDRLGLIKEEYTEYQREQEATAREPVTSATDIAQMISATESKYEIKMAEMKRNVAVLEKERSESEANWSRKLKEKMKELDDLKKVLGSAAKSREQDINVVEQLKADLGHTKEEVRILKEQLLDVPVLHEKIQDLKAFIRDKEEETRLKNLSLENLAEDHKSREAQLKQANKTLREELRKVQSSAALLERQRNPGVGYWNRVAEGDPQSPTMTSEISNNSPRPSSPAPSSTASEKNEEEVNLEYLRNVILQFLEHKEMRPSLVKVMSIILHFTPQETRRLMAKV